MDNFEVKKIWENVKVELEKTIPPSFYSLWVESLEPLGFENDEFTVLTGRALSIQLIRQNHYREIVEGFKKILGKEVSFNIIFDEALSQRLKKEMQKAARAAKKLEEKERIENSPMEHLSKMQSFANLNLKYKFDNFVVGTNNKVAYAMAMAVAQNPAKSYNPLFIYGASGLGKTHLMQAIGHYVLFNNPKLKVKYIKTEDFTNDLIDNIRKGGDRNDRMAKFRQKYRNIDVLLLDDIQFIESKERTMEEVFHTFDALHNKSKQIVITSDRKPKDIPTLPERLRTRFEWGLMVDITPPDFETRYAILKNLADCINLNVSKDILDFIAHNFSKNVRELEGAFNKISAYSAINQEILTLDTVQKIFYDQLDDTKIDVDYIVNILCKQLDVTLLEITGNSRNQKITSARYIAIYIVREITGLSFSDIAEFFNKKHPTILYAYDKIKNELKVDTELQHKINVLDTIVRGKG